MTINLLMTLQVSVILNIFLFIWLILAERARLYWKTYSEQKDITQRIAVDNSYKEGQLRNIDRIISLQDGRIKNLRAWDNYLTDLLTLSLEGEDLKPYLNTVREAEQQDED